MDLNLLLELKKMARSTFYYHMKNIGNDDKYKYVKDKIATIFHKHKGRYGYRRVTEELRKDVHGINHKTVKRLMDELGLKCEVRKVRYRSYKGDVGKTVSNVINRDFTADRPLQKVATDVTQINIGGSKIYLSPVLDMFNGEILSYVISESPNLKMVMDMLNQLYDEVGSTEGTRIQLASANLQHLFVKGLHLNSLKIFCRVPSYHKNRYIVIRCNAYI